MKRPNRFDLARFFVKVKPVPSGCWVWFAGTSSDGYGVFGWQGKSTSAHRVAYQWFVSEPTDVDHVDHLCRNRACVNPAHLEAVSKSENMTRSVWSSGFCRRGHEMTPDNVGLQTNYGKKVRVCLKCRRIREDRRQAVRSRRKAESVGRKRIA